MNNGYKEYASKKYVDEQIAEQVPAQIASDLDIAYTHNKITALYGNMQEFELVSGKLSDLVTYRYVQTGTNNAKRMKYLCNLDTELKNINDFDCFLLQIKSVYNDELFVRGTNGRLNLSGYFYIPLIASQVSSTSHTTVLSSVYVDKIFNEDSTQTDEVGKCCIQIYNSSVLTEEEYNSFIEVMENAEISIWIARKNVLALNNFIEFVPLNPYQPATKKYVDDAVATGGSVKSVNGVEPDENGNIVIEEVTSEDVLAWLEEEDLTNFAYAEDGSIYTV